MSRMFATHFFIVDTTPAHVRKAQGDRCLSTYQRQIAAAGLNGLFCVRTQTLVRRGDEELRLSQPFSKFARALDLCAGLREYRLERGEAERSMRQFEFENMEKMNGALQRDHDIPHFLDRRISGKRVFGGILPRAA